MPGAARPGLRRATCSPRRSARRRRAATPRTQTLRCAQHWAARGGRATRPRAQPCARPAPAGELRAAAWPSRRSGSDLRGGCAPPDFAQTSGGAPLAPARQERHPAGQLRRARSLSVVSRRLRVLRRASERSLASSARHVAASRPAGATAGCACALRAVSQPRRVRQSRPAAPRRLARTASAPRARTGCVRPLRPSRVRCCAAPPLTRENGGAA